MPQGAAAKRKDETNPYLSEIEPLELSPTAFPANRWQSVFQKAASDKETRMPGKLGDKEFFQKLGDLMDSHEEPDGDEAKCNFRKALKKAIKKYDPNWDEDPDERAAVMAKLKEGKAAEKKSADELASIKEIVQKSISALDVAEPKVKDALDLLAPVIGHKPVHQMIAELPAAAKAQIEMLQKSAADTAAQLAELKKSQAESARADKRREMLQKSAALSVPQMSADEVADLLTDVSAALPQHAPKLEAVLASVSGIVAKSGIFQERGTSAVPTAGGSAEAEIDRLVAAMVQKSAADGKKINESLAWNAVIEAHPELGRRYDAEKSAKSAGLILQGR